MIRPGRQIWHRYLLCGAIVVATAVLPPAPPVGACDPGQVLTEAPYDDLGPGDVSPPEPELISATRVRPRSRIGCQCGAPCIESVLIEFRVRTDEQWLRISADNLVRYVERAAGSTEDEAIFYLSPGSLPGPTPEIFQLSAFDEGGHWSAGVTVRVGRTSEAQIR